MPAAPQSPLDPDLPTPGPEEKPSSHPLLGSDDEPPGTWQERVKNAWSVTRTVIGQFLSGPDARKWLWLGGALLLVLLFPFLLRGGHRLGQWAKADDTLIILTPHNETIRREYADAFARWMKEKHGRTVAIDFRTPGGTSELTKVIRGGYYAAWEEVCDKRGLKFAEGFLSPTPSKKDNPDEWQKCREAWLADGDVNIGVDLFFGGGNIDFIAEKNAGTIVPADKSGKFGLAPLSQQDTALFGQHIPAKVSGLAFYDKELAWAGNCLSSFGIVYNKTVLDRLGLPEPTKWSDLADPRYFGQIAVADPNKSGSVTAAFEMILQQELHDAMSKQEAWIATQPTKRQEELKTEALRAGWTSGLQLIQRIGANARYFTDYSPKVPLDVSQGIAAAGMCVDFYGRTFAERVTLSGSDRVKYITPVGGSAVNVDSIALLRGAPHAELAHYFLKFLYSKEGQVLWNNKPNTPNGPQYMSLRRLPIRQDLYTPEIRAHFADATATPYEDAKNFTYTADWTRDKFEAIRLAIRVMCIDTHTELQTAWQSLITHGFPEDAEEKFGDMSALDYTRAAEQNGKMKNKSDYLTKVQLARDLASQFRRQYEQVDRQAKAARPKKPKKNP